jgi:flagellar FliJ protein
MFKFTLQIALDVRSRQEKVKMKELAEAVAVEQGILNEIDSIHANVRQADSNLNAMKRSDFFNLEQMRFLSRFKSHMKIVMTDCQKRLATSKIKVSEKQKELINAAKARKTLEILKEKEQKRFMEKITRIERKSMDEFAGNMFIRNKTKTRALDNGRS